MCPDPSRGKETICNVTMKYTPEQRVLSWCMSHINEIGNYEKPKASACAFDSKGCPKQLKNQQLQISAAKRVPRSI